MRILYDNKVFDATITSSSENGNYPWDTALKDTRLSRIGKTTGCTEEWIKFAFSDAVPVSYLAILDHNFDMSIMQEYAADNNYVPEESGVNYFNKIIHDAVDGIYVAVGQGGEIQTSPDMAIWTKQTQDSLYAGNFLSVCHADFLDQQDYPSYYAVGTGGMIQSCKDAGITWVEETADDAWTGEFGVVLVVDDYVFAAGQGGMIQALDAGKHDWTVKSIVATEGYNFKCGCYNSEADIIVLAGTNGMIWTSTFALMTVWTQRTPAGGYVGTFNGIIYSTEFELYVIVGDSGEIQTSPDSIVWTKQTPSSTAANFKDVIVVTDKLVIVGTSGEIQTSLDSEIWTRLVNDNTDYYSSIVYADGIYVVVGEIIGAFGNIPFLKLQGSNTNEWTTPDLDLLIPVTDQIIYNLAENADTFKYWRLAFSDSLNADADISIAYIFLGESLDMPGMDISQVIPHKSNSAVQKSCTGQLYGDTRIKYKAAQISFSGIEESDRVLINDFFEICDIIRPFILLIWEDDLDVEPAIYCHLTKDIEWSRYSGLSFLWNLKIDIEEVF